MSVKKDVRGTHESVEVYTPQGCMRIRLSVEFSHDGKTFARVADRISDEVHVQAGKVNAQASLTQKLRQ